MRPGAERGALVLSAALWRWQRRPLQQASTLVAFAVAVGAGFAVFAVPGVPGLLLWGVGVGFLALGVLRRTPDHLVTEAIGAAVLFSGLIEINNAWIGFGLIFTVASAVALVGLALTRKPLRALGDAHVFGIAGGFLLVQGAPSAIGYFAQEAGLVTGLIVWAIGAALIAVGATRRIRLGPVVEIGGGFATLLGAAVIGSQYTGFATLFGLGTAIALSVVGVFPGRILLTVCGSLGLLIFVPWTIGWFFPGENRAPLLVTVAGLLVLVVAVILGRSSKRFRSELGSSPRL